VVTDDKPNRSHEGRDWLGQPGIPDLGQDLDNLGPDLRRTKPARALSQDAAISLSSAHDGPLPEPFSRESQTSAGHAYATTEYASPRQGIDYVVLPPPSLVSPRRSNTAAPPGNAPPPMPCAGGGLSTSGLDIQPVEGRNAALEVATLEGEILDVSCLTVTITWGDGQTSDGYVDNTGAVVGNHTYVEEGTYLVITTITDDRNRSVTVTSTAYVSDARLTANGTNGTATEGIASTLTVARFTDTGGPENTNNYAATIDWGDGTQPSSGTITAGFNVSGTHVYMDERPNPYTVTTTIYHEDADPVTVTSTVTVNDAPLAATAGDTIRLTEEGPTGRVIVARFTDTGGPEPVGDYSATIDWGDSTASGGAISLVNGAFLVKGNHNYTEENTYTVTTTIYHEGNLAATVTTQAIVSDPSVSVRGKAIKAIQGIAFDGPVASFTDPPGPEDPSHYQATIDWGDGSTPGPATSITRKGKGFLVNGNHTYKQAGSFTIQVTINHETATPVTTSNTAMVKPSGFVVNASPIFPTESIAFSDTVATITDQNPGSGGDYSVTITWGDGDTSSGSVASSGKNTFTVTGSKPNPYAEETSDDNPSTLSISVSKGDAMDSDSSTATVADGQLTLNNITFSPTEGQSFSGTIATLTDQGQMEQGVMFTVTIDWGDGTDLDTTTGAVNGSAVTGSHTYTEEGNYDVTITVTDDGGEMATNTSSVMVQDANLLASSTGFTASAMQLYVGPVASGFVDQGGLESTDSYTVSISWGDGSTDTGGLSGDSVFGSHMYELAGTYSVMVTITDEGGSTVTVTSTAMVSDTNQPMETDEDNGCECSCDEGDEDAVDSDPHAGGNCNRDGYSEHPVRYGDGVVRMLEPQLRSGGFGTPWGHSLAWSNSPGNASHVNGVGTAGSQQPFLLQNSGGATIAVVSNGVRARFFDRQPDGSYRPRAFFQESLSYDATAGQFRLTSTLGRSLYFWDFSTSRPIRQRGQLDAYADKFGHRFSVAGRTSNGLISEFQRSDTSGSVTNTESFVYAYVPSGPNKGLLASVTLRRRVNSGAWTAVRRTEYVYYGNEAHGNVGDLKSTILKDGAGLVIDVDYRRYYKNEAGGYPHGLKYVLSPQSLARLKTVYLNPDLATDAQVAPFADQYFEYEPTGQHRVVTEVVQGAGSSASSPSGLGWYTYSYTSSCNTLRNLWAVKTVETLPDHNAPANLSENIVYANSFNQVLLKLYVTGPQASPQTWATFYRYDNSGRLLWKANPSAVITAGVNFDQYPDLLNQDRPNHYQYLRDSSGLIEITDYGASTTATATTAGDVLGYYKDTQLKQGQNGTPILQRKVTYYSRSAAGATIYPMATETVYPDTLGDAGARRTTTYSYDFYPGTTQMRMQTVTKPAVPVEQNGPGATRPDVEARFFDSYGREIWSKDADGFLRYAAYDPGTGAVLKTITDVDTTRTSSFQNLPSGWQTPSGGGLHLVTQMVVDGLGRTIKQTLPNGNVSYLAYNDANHEMRVYPGWNGLTNQPAGPIQGTREDRGHNPSYVENYTMSATPHLTAGRPDGTEAIGNLQTLSRSFTRSGGQNVETDAYFALGGLVYSTHPVLGTAGVVNPDGTVSGNYWATLSAYDGRGRAFRSTSPTRTVTQADYDGLNRPIAVQIGTVGTALTIVTQNQYDQDGVGDGNLTQTTQLPGGGAAARTARNYYDWRNRLVASKAGVGPNQTQEDTTTHRPILYRDYNNAGEVLANEQYDGDQFSVTVDATSGVPIRPPENLRRARTASLYDNQGRVYQTNTYDVVQSGPTAGTLLPSDASPYRLVSSTWFDHRSNTIKTLQPGGLVNKTRYDGVGRVAISFVTDGLEQGLTGSSWAKAGTVSRDTVLSQTETTYDFNGNPILVAQRDRFHDATALGLLGGPFDYYGANARVSFVASYYDALDRLTDSVNVGTAAGIVYTRPLTVPARSNSVLVTHRAYNAAGWLDALTDPRGLVTKNSYDNLGRVVTSVEAYTGAAPSDDKDRTLAATYDGASHIVTYTAVLPASQQTTQYTYGVTVAAGSGVNSNDLLAFVTYPDNSQRRTESFTYDALGEAVSWAQRNFNTDLGQPQSHSYSYDVLGRLTADAATVLGDMVDRSVQRLEVAYDTAGRPYLFTSYNAASAGSIVNQVQRVYNGLSQWTTEYQAHGGAVDTGATPSVQYVYSELGVGPQSYVNHSRLTSLIYPNGRQLNYTYASGLDDRISRLTSLSDASATLEAYSYLGLDTVAKRAHPQPGIDLTYIRQSGDGFGGDGGDQYTGLDRFGRVVDQRWIPTASPQNPTDRFQYGYDRDSNRLFRANLVNAAFSELYHVNGSANGYDNLNRLTAFRRGTLNSARDTISTPLHSQDWGLDAVGNWKTVTTDTNPPQNRSHNLQNQITSIDSGLVTPTYDNNGNTTGDETGKLLKYDAWNRLKEVDDASGQPLVSYSYDAAGRRNLENPGTRRDLFYSAAWQVLEERVGNDPQNQAVQIQNVWSPVYVDALVERDRDPNQSGTLSERLYVQQDANFNVTAVVNLSGQVVERYVYDPYGKPMVLSATWQGQDPGTYNWVYLHQGGRLDAVSGLYQFRNRDHSPTLGRWLQEDRVGYVDSSNLYDSDRDSPPAHLDPQGLQAEPLPLPAPPQQLRLYVPPSGGLPLGPAFTGYVLSSSIYRDIPQGGGLEYWAWGYRPPIPALVPWGERSIGPAGQPAPDVARQIAAKQQEQIRQLSFNLCKATARGTQQFLFEDIQSGTVANSFTPGVSRLVSAFAKADNLAMRANKAGGSAPSDAAKAWVRAVGNKGDIAGHAIGEQFGGKGGKESGNIFPENPVSNDVTSFFENQFARRARDDFESHVCTDVFLSYGDRQKPCRPTFIIYVFYYVTDKEQVLKPIGVPNQ
jgi:RHS repeat-associated protein